jgi:transcriptional regulator with XRE-family HTH domain
MTENWKPIAGFEGLYEASTHGRIRRLERGKKLSAADIPKIIELRESGLSHQKIATRFGVSKRNIVLIFQGRNWANDPTHRVLRGSLPSTGYFVVKLRKDGKSHRHSVHRLIAQTFIGQIPHGMCINHLDGDKKNNAVSNLEITTYAGNTQHAVKFLGWKPTIQRGPQNGCAKLTEDQVRYIKSHKSGYGVGAKLARELGVTISTISKIRCGINWSHVQ